MAEWQQALLNAIQDKAVNEVNGLHATFQAAETHLITPPQNLIELKRNMD